jgi:hypothetical protein
VRMREHIELLTEGQEIEGSESEEPQVHRIPKEKIDKGPAAQ